MEIAFRLFQALCTGVGILVAVAGVVWLIVSCACKLERVYKATDYYRVHQMSKIVKKDLTIGEGRHSNEV